jgi:hypothetical protein
MDTGRCRPFGRCRERLGGGVDRGALTYVVVPFLRSPQIDNNAAERSLRAVALGHKNHLFAGADAGGERAAGVYSLIGQAK